MDRTENTAPNISFIVASRGYRSDSVENDIPATVHGSYLATDNFAFLLYVLWKDTDNLL
jgi:hypothetical protein